MPIIIAVVVVLVVVLGGFVYSRKLASNTSPQDSAGGGIPPAQPEQAPAPDLPQIFERAEVDQTSNDPLGAVQVTIRGKLRNLLYGLVVVALMGASLWMLYFTNKLADYTTTPLTKLAATVVMVGMIIYGLWLITRITCRVKLRRSGFEISSIFGRKAYEYKDADFYLAEAFDHPNGAYRLPWFFYRYWVCQIRLHDEAKVIKLTSRRYAHLKSKIQILQNSLTTITSEGSASQPSCTNRMEPTTEEAHS